jgi:sigma-B regulation protein RsbU (phosphoserine phosphatase)
MILLCTDGIVEAMNEREEQFGQERLERIVQDDASLPPVELVRRIGAAVEAYYTGSTPADDLTVLAVRRDR